MSRSAKEVSSTPLEFAFLIADVFGVKAGEVFNFEIRDINNHVRYLLKNKTIN